MELLARHPYDVPWFHDIPLLWSVAFPSCNSWHLSSILAPWGFCVHLTLRNPCWVNFLWGGEFKEIGASTHMSSEELRYSKTIRDLVSSGQVDLQGGIYNLETGKPHACTVLLAWDGPWLHCSWISWRGSNRAKNTQPTFQRLSCHFQWQMATLPQSVDPVVQHGTSMWGSGPGSNLIRCRPSGLPWTAPATGLDRGEETSWGFSGRAISAT